MENVWNSSEIRNEENDVRNKFINTYNGQTAVDTNDERLTSINRERQQAIANSNNEYNQRINQNRNDYNNMISNTDQYYNQINSTLQEGLKKQQDAMNAQTDATINKINTQKDKANRDYLNEQKGSYVDYRNATNQYGANAEQMASNGLWGSGYSETYKSNAYNTWQNRVATARQSLNDTMTSYDQQITDALNSNNTAQAELWSNVALQVAQNSLQGFQYKNTLIESRNKLENSLIESRNNRQDTLNSRYDTLYQNTWSDMSADLNRQISNYQWGQNYLLDNAKQRQAQDNWQANFDESRRQWQAEYEQKKAYYAAQLRQSRAQLAETIRHNKASEASSRYKNRPLKGTTSSKTFASYINSGRKQDTINKMMNIYYNGSDKGSKTYAKQILDGYINRINDEYNNGTITEDEATNALSKLKYN